MICYRLYLQSVGSVSHIERRGALEIDYEQKDTQGGDGEVDVFSVQTHFINIFITTSAPTETVRRKVRLGVEGRLLFQHSVSEPSYL